MAPTRRLPPLRTALALAVGIALLSPGAGRADLTTINPGITLAYTFGQGFTYGLEVSLVQMPDTLDEFKEQPYGYGVALDIGTNFKDLFKARLGAEIIGPFIGLEAGPALVMDRYGTRLGIGITPWAGWHVMPYYTYTLTFGDGPNLHEVGTYLKLFLTPEGDGANGSAGDDWDD